MGVRIVFWILFEVTTRLTRPFGSQSSLRGGHIEIGIEWRSSFVYLLICSIILFCSCDKYLWSVAKRYLGGAGDTGLNHMRSSLSLWSLQSTGEREDITLVENEYNEYKGDECFQRELCVS